MTIASQCDNLMSSSTMISDLTSVGESEHIMLSLSNSFQYLIITLTDAFITDLIKLANSKHRQWVHSALVESIVKASSCSVQGANYA